MNGEIKAIGYEDNTLKVKAMMLAKTLNIEVDNIVLPRLSVTSRGLVLLTAAFSPLFIDFNNPLWRQRRGAVHKQGLVRACKPTKGLRIVDATAGWGRDAAVLACFGASVLMLERVPVMAALLQDALHRLHAHTEPRLDLTLLPLDAKTYLKSLSLEDYPEVIYLDPMHPVRGKSALVKKEMQVLQQWIGTDNDASELLTLALTRVRRRVVVKWPTHLPPLHCPTGYIQGKTVRFDLFSV